MAVMERVTNRRAGAILDGFSLPLDTLIEADCITAMRALPDACG